MKAAEDIFAGVLLGTAIGDALGLPAEGLSRGRIARLWRGEWRMRLVGRYGMVSDDTEHAALIAEALLCAPADVGAFQREVARRLRWWFAALPAGIGFATARACLKLWLGISPAHSGVHSAGNGAAMRSAIIGAFFADAAAKRRSFVEVATRITHTDPRAAFGAHAVAEAAAWAAGGGGDHAVLLAGLAASCGDGTWRELLARVDAGIREQQPVADFAVALGLERGVTGFVNHTVPVALFAWLRHRGDFRAALVAALDCGGDTDTVGAIVGALAGADAGADALPHEWLDAIRDWPLSVSRLRGVAARLAQCRVGVDVKPLPCAWPLHAIRNAGFLAVVLTHGFRRLLPPY